VNEADVDLRSALRINKGTITDFDTKVHPHNLTPEQKPDFWSFVDEFIHELRDWMHDTHINGC
jgi:hypothetical protein